MRKLIVGAATVLAVTLTVAAPAFAAEYRVSSGADTDPNGCTPGACTLREAVVAANGSPGRDVVLLSPRRVHTLGLEGRGEDDSAAGDLDVTDDLDIVATGRGRATVAAAGIDRAFDLHAPAKIEGLRIVGGFAGQGADAGGAGIRAAAQLSLRDTAVISNFGPESAVALLGEGGMTARDSEISHNLGSGVVAAEGGVRLAHSEVKENGLHGISGAGEGSVGVYHGEISRNGLAGAREVGEGDLALVDVVATGNGGHAGIEADDGGLYVRRSQLRANASTALDEGDAGLVHVFRTRIGSNREGAVIERGAGSMQLTKSRASANEGVAVRELDDGTVGLRETDVLASALEGVVEQGPGNAELTIADVRGSGGDGVTEEGEGAAIVNRAAVGGNDGAGLVSEGDARVYRSRIVDNRAGIQVSGGGLSLTRSTVARNRSDGGIAASDVEVTLRQTTVAHNASTLDGGGLLLEGESKLSAINTTIAHNSAGDSGGGVYAGEQTEGALNAVTVARNEAEAGGGVFAAEGAALMLENSLLAANAATAGPSCFGSFTSDAGNVLDDAADCEGFGLVGDRVTPVRIGRLGAHGGPTPTIPLRRGSAAVGAAGPDAPPRDQRNVRRVDPDAGAYERG